MRKIMVNVEALRSAAAKVGVFGDDNLTEFLGVDFTRPATLATVAAVLTRMPVEIHTVFTMVDVSDEERRPDGDWPVALAGQ